MADGSVPVIVFNPGVATGAAILWTALSNIKPPQVGYAFTPTNNDTIPSHYTNIGGGYVYSYTPPTPPVMPNVPGFISAVMSDSTINSAAQMGLAAWYPQLAMFVGQPAVLDAGWQALIQTYAGTWLTPAVQNSVETYAAQYNIPLVP
jgi:hypothetical protein